VNHLPISAATKPIKNSHDEFCPPSSWPPIENGPAARSAYMSYRLPRHPRFSRAVGRANQPHFSAMRPHRTRSFSTHPWHGAAPHYPPRAVQSINWPNPITQLALPHKKGSLLIRVLLCGGRGAALIQGLDKAAQEDNASIGGTLRQLNHSIYPANAVSVVRASLYPTSQCRRRRAKGFTESRINVRSNCGGAKQSPRFCLSRDEGGLDKATDNVRKIAKRARKTVGHAADCAKDQLSDIAEAAVGT
jgi:hypothetical protein